MNKIIRIYDQSTETETVRHVLCFKCMCLHTPQMNWKSAGITDLGHASGGTICADCHAEMPYWEPVDELGYVIVNKPSENG